MPPRTVPLALYLLVGLCYPQQEPPRAPAVPTAQMNDDEAASLSPAAQAALPRLVELMRTGIETPEPNTSFTRRLEAETLFSGSYDYHSCVLAYWALLVHARTSTDAELEGWLMERLTPSALGQEFALLSRMERPPFTFPYEHSWMLMLLAELELRPERQLPEVRDFRRHVEQELLAVLEERDFPELPPGAGESERRFVGHYRSWLFAFLLVQLAGSTDAEQAARLEALRASKLAPLRGRVAAHQSGHEYDFLHLPSILAMIERTRPAGAEAPQPGPYSARPLPDLPESVNLRNVHVVGRQLSRVWASGLLAHHGDAQARAELHEFLDAVLARGDLWSDDFTVVSHWVPQYIYVALWMAGGAP